MKTLTLAALTLTLSSSAFACPTLQGNYVQRPDGNTTITVTLGTKVEGGVYHYSLGEGSPFLPANGQPIPVESEGEKGVITMSCSGNQVNASAVRSDGVSVGTVQYLLQDSSTLVISGTGEMSALNGIYRKE